MNATIDNFTFLTYIPAVHTASISAGLVYVSLVAWFLQSLQYSCRPCVVAILVFISHFLTFTELVFRATVTPEERNTKQFFKLTTTLVRTSSQLLLAACFQCLVEMRGNMKARIIDIVQAVIVPIGLIAAAVLFSYSKKYMFIPELLETSFILRKISAGILILYIILFCVFWYFNVINVRRPYIRPLLIITSICLLADALYLLATAIPRLLSPIIENELWFYLGHTIPMFVALVAWTILYWRPAPRNADKDNDKGESGKQTLLTNSKI